MHARGIGFSILGLGIELRQANNSNALFVEGHGFEIAHNVLTQKNLCFWGDQVCVRNIARCFLQIRSCILHMPGFLETIETKVLLAIANRTDSFEMTLTAQARDARRFDRLRR